MWLKNSDRATLVKYLNYMILWFKMCNKGSSVTDSGWLSILMNSIIFVVIVFAFLLSFWLAVASS